MINRSNAYYNCYIWPNFNIHVICPIQNIPYFSEHKVYYVTSKLTKMYVGTNTESIKLEYYAFLLASAVLSLSSIQVISSRTTRCYCCRQMSWSWLSRLRHSATAPEPWRSSTAPGAQRHGSAVSLCQRNSRVCSAASTCCMDGLPGTEEQLA